MVELKTTKMTVILLLNTLVFVRKISNASATATATANSASGVVDWSMPSDIIESSGNGAVNSALNVVQRQTSQFASDLYDQVGQQSRQIRDQIDKWKAAAAATNLSFEYEYMRRASASAALTNASPQQLQLIGEAMSMLDADYSYDAVQREADLHRDCIVAAFDDLNNATRIIVGSGRTGGVDGGDVSSEEYSQQMRRVKDYVLSAVQHLRNSCPLCRALKYAAGDAGQNLLPFVTVLCSSVLKTLHPFLTSSQSPSLAPL